MLTEYKKEKARIRARLWRQNNQTKHRTYSVDYYYKNRERILAKTAKYRLENKDKINAYFRKRFHTNINHWLGVSMRSRIGKVLRMHTPKLRKSSRTFELLGCDIGKLIIHLERQFKPGMNWDNRGEWHIDHIKPIASFDLSRINQQKLAFHYSNLQPLWAFENWSKATRDTNAYAVLV